MIDIKIFTVNETQSFKCVNEYCKRLPKYIVSHITYFPYKENLFIKPGTIAAQIKLHKYGTNSAIYCRACIDQAYQLIKSKLDTKLWIFKD